MLGLKSTGSGVLTQRQAHRNYLPEWADQYYRFLARDVDVVDNDGPKTLQQ